MAAGQAAGKRPQHACLQRACLQRGCLQHACLQRGIAICVKNTHTLSGLSTNTHCTGPARHPSQGRA